MKKTLFLILLLAAPASAVDITITIDDSIAPRALTDFCAHFNYQDTIQDPANRNSTIPNPQTKIQFFRAYLVDYIKGIVVSEEGKNAARTAQDQAINLGQQQIIMSVK